MESSIQLTKEDFESKLNTIVELNTPEEVIQGLDVLLQVVCPVLDLQPGQDRSEQFKVRTIFSQNSNVNNSLLSLNGGIEELIISLGYRAVPLGNPLLKHNFQFRHTESDKIDHLRQCISLLKTCLEVLGWTQKPVVIMESKKRLPESEKLQPQKMTLQEMRKKHMPDFKPVVKDQHLDTNGRGDGNRIFINKLKFYDEKFAQSHEHMLEFNQLMFKALKEEGQPQVKCAILNTMVFDPSMLKPLLQAKVPITVFLDRPKSVFGPLVEPQDFANTNLVYQKSIGAMDFGCFHSKLILYEFDDRLRVVVSSANLYEHDWQHMGQVIWFQDFFRYGELANKSESEFQGYLQWFLDMITPLAKEKVFRQQIQLDQFDFSSAAVQLVGSVQGRHPLNNKMKLGLSRLQQICNPQPSIFTTSKQKAVAKQLVFQTSSIGSLKLKTLQDLYSCFTNDPAADVLKQISILFPTEEHVEDSHLGVANASSIIMAAKFWDDVLPKECFCRQEATQQELDLNLHHSKWIVSTSGQDGVTAEDSCVYLGSHNMSQAAWGSFEKNKTQICIYNCELGVVFGPGQSQAVKELVVNTLPIKSSKPAKYNLAVDRPFIMEKQQIYRNNFEK